MPGSLVGHAGAVRFEPTEDGGTRVTVRPSYNPVVGAVAHAVAVLLGADPKQAMDDDLLRFTSLVEAGRSSARGHTVARQDPPR